MEEWLELRRLIPELESSVNVLDTLIGVSGKFPEEKPLRRDSLVKSSLLPAKSSVRLGEARARASFKKVGSALNEVCEVRS